MTNITAKFTACEPKPATPLTEDEIIEWIEKLDAPFQENKKDKLERVRKFFKIDNFSDEIVIHCHPELFYALNYYVGDVIDVKPKAYMSRGEYLIGDLKALNLPPKDNSVLLNNLTKK